MLKRVKLFTVKGKYDASNKDVFSLPKEFIQSLYEKDEEGNYKYKYQGIEVSGKVLLTLLPFVTVEEVRSLLIDDDDIEDYIPEKSKEETGGGELTDDTPVISDDMPF